MLLLVLILVLAAFALLVVALVQGSVLWAWLSVAISVAAASVLLVDWWQRQQAARDDEELPPPAPAPDLSGGSGTVTGSSGPVGSADYDSVTEFIPVTPPMEGLATGSDGPEAETGFLPQEQSGAPGEPSANEQTVMLPVARPPGSAEQPPGAVPGTPPWSASSSQSVAAGGPPPGLPDWSGGPSRGQESVQHTVDSSIDGTVDGTVDGTTRPGHPDARAEPTDDQAGTPEDPDGPTGLFATASGVASAVSGTSSTEPADQKADQTADERSAQAGDGSDQQATGASAPQQPAGQLAAADATPDLTAGPDGEPPEEPHDPVAAAVAASAEDEVVVVDERPRYHVEGCSFLSGRPVIPLPVREAVELGFSACGWCRPNLTLARRHQPAAR